MAFIRKSDQLEKLIPSDGNQSTLLYIIAQTLIEILRKHET